MNIEPSTPIDERLLAALWRELNPGAEPDDMGIDSELLIELQSYSKGLDELWACRELVSSPAPIDIESEEGPAALAGDGAGPSQPPAPLQFDRFELIERAGQGGFGLVFRARDPLLNREVALKVPRPEVLMTPALRRRFLREARAAAALDHPNIVAVHDAGEVGPLCYIASAFCEGPTLSAWLRDRPEPVPSRRAARLIQTLASAVQHAHDRGILHRDLKPSNILLQGDPDEPDLDTFMPRISDFGLAKIVDEIGDDTRTDVPMGSPPYMSPEQVLGRSREIGVGSDVYALGAILYQIVSGRTPFEGESRVELMRQIIEADPVPPRSLRPDLPRDLETICLKCLAKEPRRRYPSAESLARDLGRFLEGEPVHARPTPIWEQAAKWCRRKPWQAAAALLGLASILGSAGVIAWRADTLRRHNVELRAALSLAERHESTTQRLLYSSQLKLAQQALASGHPEYGQEILAGLRLEPGRADLRGFEWRYLNRLAYRDVSLLFDHKTRVGTLALSPDGRTLAVGDWEGLLIIWDIAGGRERARVRAHAGRMHQILFAPSGRFLASRTQHEKQQSEVKLWDSTSGRALAGVPGITGTVLDVCFSNQGHTLLLEEQTISSPLGKRFVFWNLSQGAEILGSHTSFGDYDYMVISPDERRLATVAADNPRLVTLRDPATRRAIKSLATRFPLHAKPAISPDGNTLSTAAREGLSIWDIEAARETAFYELSESHSIAFSSDGNHLVGISLHRDGILPIADLRTKARRLDLQGISGRSFSAAFSSDSRRLVVGGIDLPPTIWDTSTGRKLAVFPGNVNNACNLIFTPDGQSLIFATTDGRVLRWRFDAREPIHDLAKEGKEVWALAYTPDGSTLVSAGDDHLIKLRDPREGTLKATLKGHESLVAGVAVNRDGTKLASASYDTTVRLWDLRQHRELAVLRGHADRVHAVAFSPDGRRVASGSHDKTVRIWDVETGQTLSTFRGQEDPIFSLTFDSAGKILVTASNDRTVKVLDAETGKELSSLSNSRRAFAVALSPDDSLLASADEMGGLTFWDTATWTMLKTVKGSDVPARALAFSPDGKTLAAACDDAKVRLWDPVGGQMLLELSGHTRRVNALAFSPDGKTLASAGHEGSIKLWQADSTNMSPSEKK